jgi:hypothetical protein
LISLGGFCSTSTQKGEGGEPWKNALKARAFSGPTTEKLSTSGPSVSGLWCGPRSPGAGSPSSSIRSPRERSSPHAPPSRQRGRVQLRSRGTHGGPARGRGGVRGEGASRLQAPQPVAHVLERRRRGVPDPRDHLPRRVRASVRGDGRGSGVDGRRGSLGARCPVRHGGRLRQRGATMRRARAHLPHRRRRVLTRMKRTSSAIAAT